MLRHLDVLKACQFLFQNTQQVSGKSVAIAAFFHCNMCQLWHSSRDTVFLFHSMYVYCDELSYHLNGLLNQSSPIYFLTRAKSVSLFYFRDNLIGMLKALVFSLSPSSPRPEASKELGCFSIFCNHSTQISAGSQSESAQKCLRFE